MVPEKTSAKQKTSWSRAGDRARRLENCCAKPTASLFPDQSCHLPLWPNLYTLPHLHALGNDRTHTGTFPLRLPRDIGPVRPQSRARQNSSTHGRILDLGRRVL